MTALRFEPLPIAPGLLLDLGSVRVFGLTEADGRGVELDPNATSWILVTAGRASVLLSNDELRLGPAQFAVLSEPGTVRGGHGIVLSQRDYRGVRQVGGPLEARGRLRYVDGCSDTLLVCPPRLGEPCLNHLHIPPNTLQSTHHHPSLRLGVIARGRGVCRTEGGDTPLEPGLAWHIPAGLPHCFVTRDESLDVFAWHPDSDFGPTDEDHPMINRTLMR